jgi:hypothetical protein
MYTQIDRDESNRPEFSTYKYRVRDKDYFYPASTVKLPSCLLALEKINNLNINGLDKNSTMFTDSIFEWQKAIRKDSTAENNSPSITHYIKKILLVSDNEAFNRLYEFIGQNDFNNKLSSKGYDVRISHRLSVPNTFEQNKHTNPIRFFNCNELLYKQEAIYNPNNICYKKPILKGKGYIKDDQLISEPMDFAYKNYYTHQRHDERDEYSSMGFFRKLRHSLANGYTNWRYGTQAVRSSLVKSRLLLTTEAWL